MRKPTKAARAKRAAPTVVPAKKVIGTVNRVVSLLETTTPLLRKLSKVDDADVDLLYRIADRLLMERRIVWMTAQTCDDHLRGVHLQHRQAAAAKLPAVVIARSPREIKRRPAR